MMPRRAVAAAAAALLLTVTLGVTACMPEPEPTPTPTGFASEAEAFAAAEETYRAYVDALNQVDLSDPDTFEPVFAWTTGEANADERQSVSQMHADEWAVSGETVTEAFLPTAYTPEESAVVAAVACSNVSDIQLVDATGISMVSPDRRDVYALALEFQYSETSATLLQISSSTAVEDSRCA